MRAQGALLPKEGEGKYNSIVSLNKRDFRKMAGNIYRETKEELYFKCLFWCDLNEFTFADC